MKFRLVLHYFLSLFWLHQWPHDLFVAAALHSDVDDTNQPFLANDFSCRSSSQPNPVVVLHGALSNADDKGGVLAIQKFLQQRGFCVFALTYGAYPALPSIGGLRPINESSQEIAKFVQNVYQNTGAKKINLVGHSEGAFQVLYVPKFTGISHLLDVLVAIAPPTKGCSAQVFNLLPTSLRQTIIRLGGDVGLGGMTDILYDSPAVQKLNDGFPIVQQGNKLTVIASRNDIFVTPTANSFVHEPGVDNFYVQDYCPLDPVGHIGACTDDTVLTLTANALARQPQVHLPCVLGKPIR